jgi:3-phenylpropionate/trans-cinnamate dioxygenase ferredoxin subunit
MHDKKYQWYKIADSDAMLHWNANNLAIAEVEGKKITLCKTKNRFYACAYKCPHASGILAEGFIDNAENIVCPVHGYRFSLRNGRNIGGEEFYLKTYKTETREDGIYVAIEEGNFENKI